MDSTLAERIRTELAGLSDTGEIRMFGGICFMLNGNMVAGTMKDGALLVRVGADGLAVALARPGATRMDMGGRQMKGYVLVSPDHLDDAALREWLAVAKRHVDTLPPKPKKPAADGKPAKTKRR